MCGGGGGGGGAGGGIRACRPKGVAAIFTVFNITGPHPATSQLCLYNYTIGAALPVIITQSAPMCLICPQTSATTWAVSGGSTPPTIPGAPYILYVVSPVTTFVGGPQVGCLTSSTLIAASTGMCGIVLSNQILFNLCRYLHTVGIAAPVIPQVVTYVNETETLNLACSTVVTVTSSAVAFFGQSWLGPLGNTISTRPSATVSNIIRTAAGNYTCVTKLIPNANGVANVTGSTQVVVYCE